MGQLQDEIRAAVQTLGLAASQFYQLPEDEGIHIFKHAEACFVTSPGRRWWWEVFKYRHFSVAFQGESAYKRLVRIVPLTEEMIYFIVNVEEGYSDPVLVFLGTIKAIQAVIGECFFFEYYLVSPSWKWLECETHHGEFIALGFRAMIRLMRYAKGNSRQVYRSLSSPVR